MLKNTLTPKKIVSLPKGAKMFPFTNFARQAGIKFKDSGSLVISDKKIIIRKFLFLTLILFVTCCAI